MAVMKHIHRYILRNLGSKEKPRKLYACSLPDCTHFMPTNKLVIGKHSLCWGCGEQFVIGYDQIRAHQVKPTCRDCKDKRPCNLPKVKEIQLKRLKEKEKQDEAINSLLERMKL